MPVSSGAQKALCLMFDNFAVLGELLDKFLASLLSEFLETFFDNISGHDLSVSHGFQFSKNIYWNHKVTASKRVKTKSQTKTGCFRVCWVSCGG
jgi:hypothetical protein